MPAGPDDIAVDRDIAAASPLAGRVEFRTDDSPGATPPGTSVVRTDLLPTGLARLWRNYPRTSDVGLRQLIAPQEFSAALRLLVDDLLLAAAPGADRIAVTSRGHADPECAAVIGRLYPDAWLRSPSGDRPPAFDPAPPGPRPTRETDGGDSRLTDRLILVVGCGRSGTTWLHELLRAHPDIAGVPCHESWLFEQVHPLWDPQRSGMPGRAATVAALRRFCDTVLAGPLGSDPRASYLLEKTPMHSYRLPEIAAVYPDAWFVHVIRDGREVARSISQVPFFQAPDPAAGADQWRRVLASVRDGRRSTPRFRELRYEQLLTDPDAVLSGLVRWIGLDSSPEAMSAMLAQVPRRVSTHAGADVPLGGHGWRALPRSDIRGIYRVAGRELIRQGYASRLQALRGAALGSAR